MEQLAQWSVFVDIALAVSLVVFAFRYLRGGENAMASSRMIELEGSLRELIQHAERSGTSLNEELLKRKGSLEKLLFELGTAEHRINKTVTEAEEERKVIRDLIETLRKEQASQPRSAAISESVAEQKEEPQAPAFTEAVESPPKQQAQTSAAAEAERQAEYEAAMREPVAGTDEASEKLAATSQPAAGRIRIPIEKEVIRERKKPHEEMPVEQIRKDIPMGFPEDFQVPEPEPRRSQGSAAALGAKPVGADEEVIPLGEQTRRASAAESEDGVRRAMFPRVESEQFEGRIFRGKRDKTTEDPFKSRNAGLRSRIEKEVSAPTPKKSSTSFSSSLEEVYSKAEQLLRAGKSIEETAAALQLPSEEVQKVLQYIRSTQARSTEASAQEATSKTSRSPIQQQKQTL